VLDVRIQGLAPALLVIIQVLLLLDGARAWGGATRGVASGAGRGRVMMKAPQSNSAGIRKVCANNK
jgi:hypothetical protein